MTLTNTSKPTTSVTNITRADSSERWETITTAWASETRTWDGTGSKIGNLTKTTTSITNTSKPA